MNTSSHSQTGASASNHLQVTAQDLFGWNMDIYGHPDQKLSPSPQNAPGNRNQFCMYFDWVKRVCSRVRCVCGGSRCCPLVASHSRSRTRTFRADRPKCRSNCRTSDSQQPPGVYVRNSVCCNCTTHTHTHTHTRNLQHKFQVCIPH